MNDELTLAEQMGASDSEDVEYVSPWRRYRLYFFIFLAFPGLYVLGAGIWHVSLKSLVACTVVGVLAAMLAYGVNE